MSFSVGHNATLHDLESRAELNGQRVTLLARMEDGEQPRQIDVVDRGQVLTVEQSNLRRVWLFLCHRVSINHNEGTLELAIVFIVIGCIA
jgi:hypothetical protein